MSWEASAEGERDCTPTRVRTSPHAGGSVPIPASLLSVSNAAGATARREEEIAFLAMEQVLGVDIRLADAGAGNKKPDGTWVYPDGQGRRGIVEVTSPPDKELMADWARAKKAGELQSESGLIPVRWNQLAQVCTELLAQDWALENVAKLVAEAADERHLYLFARSYRVGDYFYRLSDSYDDDAAEQIDDLVLPEGITDVWFGGRARRDEAMGAAELRVARFQAGTGWCRHVVSVEETGLPSPNPSIADDPVPVGRRDPKDRTAHPDLTRSQSA